MVLLKGKENEENIYTSECGINISPPIPSLLPHPKPTRQLTQRIKTLQTPTFGIIINFWVINTWNCEKKIILPFMGQMSHAKILGYKSWPCYKFSSSSPDSPQICSVRLSSPSAALIGDNPLTEIPSPPLPPPCDNQRLYEQVMAWHTPSVQSKQDQREPISIQIICSVITRFVIEAKQ